MERAERWSSAAGSPPSILRLHSVLPQTLSSCIPSVTTHTLLKNLERNAVYVHVPQMSSNKCSILKKQHQNEFNMDLNSAMRQQQQQQPTASILKNYNKNGDHQNNQNEPNTSNNHISHHHHHHHHSVPVTYSTTSSSVVDFSISSTATTTTPITTTTTTTATPQPQPPPPPPPSAKRHGILKKRSSLDESQIIRRRSCSPDVISLAKIVNSTDFKPILKHQRRSSLDEIVRRAQSPDLHPTSILKNNVTRENDREFNNVGSSSEPQGILKRKSWSNIGETGSTVGGFMHVNIAANFLQQKLNNNSGVSEFVDISEVRPILKKKHSRDDCLWENVCLEPRPILKKKSSLECEESLDDMRPKKTILKSLQKQSSSINNQSFNDYTITTTTTTAASSSSADNLSPKKLSMLRNCLTFHRSSENLRDYLIDNNNRCENNISRPILKQNYSSMNFFSKYETSNERNFYRGRIIAADKSHSNDDDLFFRKRAQSVENVVYHKEEVDNNELLSIIGKRRSLESVCLNDDRLRDRYRCKFITKGISELPDHFLSLQCSKRCLNDVSTKDLKIPDRYVYLRTFLAKDK